MFCSATSGCLMETDTKSFHRPVENDPPGPLRSPALVQRKTFVAQEKRGSIFIWSNRSIFTLYELFWIRSSTSSAERQLHRRKLSAHERPMLRSYSAQNSRTTACGSLSSRSPLKVAWRNKP